MIFSPANQFLLRVYRIFPGIHLLRFLSWLVLLVSLLVTYQLWKVAQNKTEQALQTEFNFHVLDATHRIERHMLEYEKMLRGVQGLYAASASVSREEFRQYVNLLDIEKNYPGIQGLGFTLLLPSHRLAQHLAEVRREGFPDYAIRPAGERDSYSSVLYLEPFTGRNLHAFGYDNFADPLRRTAMERVRDTGLCTISGKIKLVQEIDSNVQAGILMWLPVYRNNAKLNTVEERRKHLIGWIGASFRMDNLMASIVDMRDAMVDIEIYDGDEMSDRTLMYDADHVRREKNPGGSHFQTIRQLNIAGQKWSVLISSLPRFDARLRDQKQSLILLGGIVVSILLALITLVLIRGRSRALEFAQALNHELAERKRAEAGIRLAATVFDTVDTAVLVTDKGTRIIKVNPAFTAITGYTSEDAIGKTPRILSSGAHTREFYREMWHTIKTTGSWQGEIFNRRKNGEFFTEWLSINEVRDNEGNLSNYVSLFSDISERKAAEEHMHNLAHYDPLTGLPNRTLLADRLQQAISAARREKTNMALMFIDLDKFKPVNDTLGHHIGDLMLKEVANRMLECLRESDSAARIGGDEFIVLLPVIEVEADAVAVAEKIRLALNQPFNIAEHSLNISSSIGVAVYPDHGTDEKSLLRHADTAMYFAKEAGRNNVMLYAHTMMRNNQ
ncbi:MAG: hypothetical protein B7Y56_14135 [Gallionellales bacterium 35-53-114]|jgi:diguanylate cyclase (GGDEF)-like protein/PAS domain S-box-containing protein|nr:MAG: hypothetical protein B7Y56_14135 [Gallionellales bacterium 35-53-114]OYZ62345.1 MAG: hypothetical protein B7Y04_14385 [Gallionellales bacterium 24-53-125]OZB07385.1 MAG: hypothetical protein B7X61_14805 [Gallionellales bacterium 39-52-133]HQS59558.1 CHASE domain-containing protein [Gallionellaceae bacterium]HQS75539.1 CHASE domain-containing protein [Gallionellaceae bacterium]